MTSVNGKKKLVIVFVIVLLIAAVFLLPGFSFVYRVKNPCVQEYLPGVGNIKGNVNTERFLTVSEDFAIGADHDGNAVFKDPAKALRALREHFGKTLLEIRLQNLLPGLSPITCKRYKQAAFEPAWASTNSEKPDAAFVLGFLDIYENSFGT